MRKNSWLSDDEQNPYRVDPNAKSRGFLDMDSPARQQVEGERLGGGGGGGRKLVALLVLVASLAGGGMLFLQMRGAEMVLVNGLDLAVEVSIDEETISLAALGQTRVRVAAGEHAVIVRTTDGRSIDAEMIDVPSFTDVVVYSVGGAAALWAREIVYSTEIAPIFGGDDSAYELYAGQTFITRDDVEYVFEDPPETISVSGSRDEESHWYFGFSDERTWGWRPAVLTLMGSGRQPEARALMAEVLRIDPNNPLVREHAAGMGLSVEDLPVADPSNGKSQRP